jgi:transposase
MQVAAAPRLLAILMHPYPGGVAGIEKRSGISSSLLPPDPECKSRLFNDQQIINGILWSIRTGAPWRNVPEKHEKNMASCRFAFACFRSRTRRRFLLRFGLIEVNGRTDEIFESALINLVTLEKIDRTSRIAFEAGVEKLVRIRESCPVSKGKLHLPFVGVGDRDHSVARPHRASHPLPFLDDLPVGRKDALADAGERFAAPVREFCDQLVNPLRWIHWISLEF